MRFPTPIAILLVALTLPGVVGCDGQGAGGSAPELGAAPAEVASAAAPEAPESAAEVPESKAATSAPVDAAQASVDAAPVDGAQLPAKAPTITPLPENRIGELGRPLRLETGRTRVEIAPELEQTNTVTLSREGRWLRFGPSRIAGQQVRARKARQAGGFVGFHQVTERADYRLHVEDDRVRSVTVLESPTPIMQRGTRQAVLVEHIMFSPDLRVSAGGELFERHMSYGPGTHVLYLMADPKSGAEGAGRLLWTINRPVVLDANGARVEATHSLELDRSGRGRYEVHLVEGQSPAYPLVIDPDVQDAGDESCGPPLAFSSLSGQKVAGCEIIPYGHNQMRLRSFLLHACDPRRGVGFRVGFGDGNTLNCAVDEFGNLDAASSDPGCPVMRNNWMELEHRYETSVLPCGAELKVTLEVCNDADGPCTEPITCGNYEVGAVDDDNQPPSLLVQPPDPNFPPGFRFNLSDPSGLSSVSVVVTRDGREFDRCECSVPEDGTDCALSPCVRDPQRFRYGNCGNGTYGLVVNAADNDKDCIGDQAVMNEVVNSYPIAPAPIFGLLDVEDCDGLDDNCNGIVDESLPGCATGGHAPIITIDAPQDGDLLTAEEVEVTGQARSDADTNLAAVTVNGQPAQLDGERFLARIILPQGEQRILVSATDDIGREETLEISVTVDLGGPTLTIDAPEEDALLPYPDVSVTGSVSDPIGVASVTVNGEAAAINGDRYSASLTLESGAQTITVVARDTGGNETTVERQVTVSFTPPLGLRRPTAVAPGQGNTAFVAAGQDPRDLGPGSLAMAWYGSVPIEAPFAGLYLTDIRPGVVTPYEHYVAADIVTVPGGLLTFDSGIRDDGGVWFVPVGADGRPTSTGAPAGRNGAEGRHERIAECPGCAGIGDSGGATLGPNGELYHLVQGLGAVARLDIGPSGKPTNVSAVTPLGAILTRGAASRKAPVFVGGVLYFAEAGGVRGLAIDGAGAPSFPLSDLVPAGTLADITDMLALPDGSILVLSKPGALHRLDPADGSLTEIPTDTLGLSGPEGFALDGGRLWIANTLADEVLRLEGFLDGPVGNEVVVRYPTIAPRTDATDPVLTIEAPTEGSTHVIETPAGTALEVRGTVTDESPVLVWANGAEAELLGPADGGNEDEVRFIVRQVPLTVGDNTIEVIARDSSGNEIRRDITVTLESVPADLDGPGLSLTTPRDGDTVLVNRVLVRGRVISPLETTVLVQGVVAHVVGREFTAGPIALSAGRNDLEVSATDSRGATVQLPFVVFRRFGDIDPVEPPAPGTFADLAVHPPSPTGVLDVEVSGRGTPGATVTVAGPGGAFTVVAGELGHFSVVVTLAPGVENVLAVSDTAGAAGQLTVVHDDQPPFLELITPADETVLNDQTVTPVFRVTDDRPGVTLRVEPVSDDPANSHLEGGVDLVIVQDIAFAPMMMPNPVNRFTAIATDEAGNEAVLPITYYFGGREPENPTDLEAPTVQILTPYDGELIGEETIPVVAVVEDDHPFERLRATINGAPATLAGNLLTSDIDLVLGPNTIRVEVTDAAGNVANDEVTVTFTDQLPATPILDPLPARTEVRSLVVSGAAPANHFIWVAGASATVLGESDPVSGAFSVTVELTENRDNFLTVVAQDRFTGLTSEPARATVRHDTRAPQVLSVDPPPGATGIALDQVVSVRFDEPVDGATVDETSFTLRTAAAPLSAEVQISADGSIVRLVPRARLPDLEQISLTVTASVADPSGRTLAEEFTSAFTTAPGPGEVRGLILDLDENPIGGVLVSSADGRYVTRTDLFGGFELELPEGLQKLRFDGGSLVGKSYATLLQSVVVTRGETSTLKGPVFLAEVDPAGGERLDPGAGGQVLEFDKDPGLEDFTLSVPEDAVRFPDGLTNGQVTASVVGANHVPLANPDGSLPALLVALEPSGTTFEPPCQVEFPNVNNLAPGEQVEIFSFEEDPTEQEVLGTGTVVEVTAEDGSTKTVVRSDEPCVAHFSFIGYRLQNDDDLTVLSRREAALEGRVVDILGNGIAGVAVSLSGTGSRVTTGENGTYRLPLPARTLHKVRVFAAVPSIVESEALAARPKAGSSIEALVPPGPATMVFASEEVAPPTDGVGQAPDIVVDVFEWTGELRYANADGHEIPQSDVLLYDEETGALVSVTKSQDVRVMLLCRDEASGAFSPAPFASVDADPTLPTERGGLMAWRTTVLNRTEARGETRPIVAPGTLVRVVAFDTATGWLGFADATVPDPAADGTFLLSADVMLRPPSVELEIDRHFDDLDGNRQVATLEPGGIALAGDEFTTVAASWKAGGVPVPPIEGVALFGGVTVDAPVGGGTFRFLVKPGYEVPVVVPRDILAQRNVLLGERPDAPRFATETITVTAGGFFNSARPVPTSQRSATATANVSELRYIVADISVETTDDGGLKVTGTVPAGTTLEIALPDGSTALVEPDENGVVDSVLGGVSRDDASALDVTLIDGEGEVLGTVNVGLTLRPEIDAIVPGKGRAGDLVVITGRDFSDVPGRNDVRFVNARARVVSAGPDRLTVEVPADGAPGDVTVTIGSHRSEGVFFDYINDGLLNGSFESGFEHWVDPSDQPIRLSQGLSVLEPTDGENAAMLKTDYNPSQGHGVLTSALFDVPAGMQAIALDLGLFYSNPVTSPAGLVRISVVPDEAPGDLVVEHPLQGVLSGPSTLGGFREFVPWMTAVVDVSAWAGKRQALRLVIELLGDDLASDRLTRLQLPKRGINPNINVTSPEVGYTPGTAVMVDRVRLVAHRGRPQPVDLFATEQTGGDFIAGDGAVPTDSSLVRISLITGRATPVELSTGGGFKVFRTDVAQDAIPKLRGLGEDIRYFLSVQDPSGNRSIPLLVEVE